MNTSGDNDFLGSIFMKESLLEIKNAEEKAADIVKSANEDTKRMIEDAKKKKEEIYNNTITQTQNEIEKIKKQYRDEGTKEAKKIASQGERELEMINKKAKENFSKAVDAAMQRVVE